jgi:hypothetical protein
MKIVMEDEIINGQEGATAVAYPSDEEYLSERCETHFLK